MHTVVRNRKIGHVGKYLKKSFLFDSLRGKSLILHMTLCIIWHMCYSTDKITWAELTTVLIPHVHLNACYTLFKKAALSKTDWWLVALECNVSGTCTLPGKALFRSVCVENGVGVGVLGLACTQGCRSHRWSFWSYFMGATGQGHGSQAVLFEVLYFRLSSLSRYG